MTTKQQTVVNLASRQGVIKPRDLHALGVSHRVLQGLISKGILTHRGRGLYSLSDYDVTEFHSLVEAACAQPKAVVCLLSALSFHGIGTRLPWKAWLAIPRGGRVSATRSVPIEVVFMRPESYNAGIETHVIEGVTVPIYCVAKTVADCFKFRRSVGLEAALEALREVLRDRKCTREEIRHFAKIDRVENVMRPYVEALS